MEGDAVFGLVRGDSLRDRPVHVLPEHDGDVLSDVQAGAVIFAVVGDPDRRA